MNWIASPYYTKPPDERVDCGPIYKTQVTADSAMQEIVRQMVNTPVTILRGGIGKDEIEMKAILTTYAQLLADRPFAGFTAIGFDPAGAGAYYTKVIVDILKQIQYGVDGVSYYNMWVRVPDAG